MMVNINSESEEYKNQDSYFTELFNLLMHLEISSDGCLISDDLKVMNQHIENAVYVLLHGLQDLGRLLGLVMQDQNKLIRGIDNIGFFISAITNLTEALNTLKANIDYMLNKKA